MSEETSAQKPADAVPAVPEPVNPAPAAYGAPAAPEQPVAAGMPAPSPAVPGAVAPGVQLPAAAVPLPPENVLRGFLLSLIVVPVGIAIWLIIWNLGYIASIVALVIAFGAYFLYKKGSGGRISIRGALLVALVTVVTIVVAFLVGILSDVVNAVAAGSGLGWTEVLATPGFGGYVMETLSSPQVAGAVLADAGLTALFGLLGCVGVIVSAFREAKAQSQVDAAAPQTPEAPTAA